MAAEALAKDRRGSRPMDVRAVEGSAMFEIYSHNGGPPPLPLQGQYTSEEYARRALGNYVQTGR